MATAKKGRAKAKRRKGSGKKSAAPAKLNNPLAGDNTTRARPRELNPIGPDLAKIASKAKPHESVQTPPRSSPEPSDNSPRDDDDDEAAAYAGQTLILAAILSGKEPPGDDLTLPKTYTTAQRKAALIERVAESGDEVNGAAKALGISRKAVWEWKRDDLHFADALEYSYRVDGTAALVSVAVRRSVHGWLEPVYNKGVLCGFIRKYDHTLLMRIIQKRDPAYRDPKFAIANEAPKLPGEVSIDLDKATPQERAVIRKMAERQAKAAAKDVGLAR